MRTRTSQAVQTESWFFVWALFPARVRHAASAMVRERLSPRHCAANIFRFRPPGLCWTGLFRRPIAMEGVSLYGPPQLRVPSSFYQRIVNQGRRVVTPLGRLRTSRCPVMPAWLDPGDQDSVAPGTKDEKRAAGVTGVPEVDTTSHPQLARGWGFIYLSPRLNGRGPPIARASTCGRPVAFSYATRGPRTSRT